MKFTKGNQKHKRHRPTKEEADVFAIKTMLDHKANGIDLPVEFYEGLSNVNQGKGWDGNGK